MKTTTKTKPAEAAIPACWKCTPVKGGADEYDDLCARHRALEEAKESRLMCKAIAAELARYSASNASDNEALGRARAVHSDLTMMLFGIPAREVGREIERGQR